MPNHTLTPLTKSRTEILAIHRDILRNPPAITTPAFRRQCNLWCAYHNDHGHETEYCNYFQKAIEDCLRNGMLQEYVVCAGQNQPGWNPRFNTSNRKFVMTVATSDKIGMVILDQIMEDTSKGDTSKMATNKEDTSK